MYHAPIGHVDIVLARCLLEFISTTLALAIIFVLILSAGLAPPPVDPGLALAGWLFSAWHFSAIGILTGMATEYWVPLEKFVQPWQYFQLPVSGVFFMVDWMPTFAQKLLLWNPTVHCYEMVRAGYFGESITTHYDLGYMVATNLAISLVACILLVRVRQHLEVH